VKRDLDLIRAILLRVESDGKLGIPGVHTDEEIADHALQLKESGLVEGEIVRNRIGIPCEAVITRITSSGHDFIAKIRNETVWAKTKAYVLKHSPDWTISLVKLAAGHVIANHH
jgi:hypothetical protein